MTFWGDVMLIERVDDMVDVLEDLKDEVNATRRELAHLSSVLNDQLTHLVVATGHSGGR